jgi:phage repressor protein C with HTH and peptisase S24 domain
MMRQTEVIVGGRRFRQVRVRGDSMRPGLVDGDVVLARLGARVRADDVVLVRWAARPGRLSVKRAQWAEGDGWFVVSDNVLPEARDSNHFGPAEVVGVIRWRLWPRPGRVR